MKAARNAAALGCALVLAFSLVGCGGGADKVSPVVQYRADANKLCKAALTAIRATAAHVSVNSADAKAKKAVFAKAGTGFLTEISDLKKLKVPGEIADEVATWLGDLTVAATKTRDHGLELVAAGVAPFVQADAEAKALKLDECQSSGR